MKTPSPKQATRLGLLAAAMLSIHAAEAQTTLYSDNFATDSSANWTVFANTTDYLNQFAFNYATNKYVKGGVTNNIPLAPNSTVGETNGLKISVNDTLGQVTAVNLFLKNRSFTNNYTLKFDMWLNYTGTGFGNGVGGTEDAIFGINHRGTTNSFNATGGGVSSSEGDGVSFAVSADGDYTRDYQAFVGDGINPLTELQTTTGGFLDRDNDGNTEFESNALLPATHPLKLMFPSPTFESAGMPSKEWVQVEVRQRTNDLGEFVVTWLINGYVIAEHGVGDDSPYFQTNGTVMVGMLDPFAGIATPLADSFLIYDNIRVIDLNSAPTNEVVSITATDATATEPSGDDGIVTISRSGSTALPLTVPFRTAGTATRNADYQIQTNGVTITNATAVVIPAGASSVDLTIKVLDDLIGEADESAVIVLAGNPSAYDIRSSISAAVTLVDNGDLPTVSVQGYRIGAYEGNTNRYGEIRVVFSSPYNAGDLTVNYQLAGTAVNGTDYETLPTSTVVAGGTMTNSIIVIPKQNSDTVSNRTVIVRLLPGSNYNVTTNATGTNATVNIFNDDLSAATATVFSDNFDVDSSPNWNSFVSTAANDVTYAYDYSQIGVPPAPRSSGTTLGMRIRANSPLLGSAVQSGVSASPKNVSFTNDFRMRCDMWISVPGPFPGGGAGSTQIGTMGIGSGTVVQWASTAVSSNWVLFGSSGDGNNATDYRVYCPTGGTAGAGAQVTTDTGVYMAGTTAAAQQNTAALYSFFGPQGAPVSQSGVFLSQSGELAVGCFGQVWHDVVITKLGSTVLWDVDGIRLAAINTATRGTKLSTNIFVGQFDVNGTQTSVALDQFSCNLVDNLVVEQLPNPTVPTITSIAFANNTNVVVNFTGSTSDFPLLFSLVSSTNVTGTFNYTRSTITQSSPGVFQAVTPYTTNAANYYRILR